MPKSLSKAGVGKESNSMVFLSKCIIVHSFAASNPVTTVCPGQIAEKKSIGYILFNSRYNLKSSTYFDTVICFKLTSISLIYTTNNRKPRTDPCKTPDSIALGVKSCSNIVTTFLQLRMKDFFQL